MTSNHEGPSGYGTEPASSHSAYGHGRYDPNATWQSTDALQQPPAPQPVYASWLSRVGAAFIDGFICSLPATAIGAILAVQDVEGGSDFGGASTYGDLLSKHWPLVLLGMLLTLAIRLWNEGYLQGTTGRSLGKRVLKIDVVDAETGAVLGSRRGMMRVLVDEVWNLPSSFYSPLSLIALANYIWPWWDQRNQTWTDKVVKSVVVKQLNR